MLSYVVDLDDLCDTTAHRLSLLERIKEKYPAFVVTLFTIPNRTSDETIAKYKEHPWIALGVHGFHHTRGECLTWARHEAEAKILKARSRGIDAPVFRAPAWLINRPTYEVCRDLGIVVADHKDNYLHVKGTKVYRYNDPIHRRSKVRTTHGHMTKTPAVDNFMEDMVADGRLSFATKSEFLFPWDACVELGEEPKDSSV